MKYRFNFLIVNLITFLRLMLSIYFFHLIILENNDFINLFSIFMIIGLSDFVDGKLARMLCVQSKFGCIFDVVVDFFFVFSSSVALNLRGLYPLWLIIFVVFKMFEFIITSHILVCSCKNSCFVFDIFGKFVAFLIYILPIFILFLYTSNYEIDFLLFYFIGLMMLISTGYRLSRCVFKISKNKYL